MDEGDGGGGREGGGRMGWGGEGRCKVTTKGSNCFLTSNKPRGGTNPSPNKRRRSLKPQLFEEKPISEPQRTRTSVRLLTSRTEP